MTSEKIFKMVKERHRQTFEDASKENKVDSQLIELCKFIAGTKHFFTSSGCSGRILLLKLKDDGLKRKSQFHRRWHSTVEFDEFWKAVNEKTEDELWMKVESFIIHIGTDSFENAQKILEVKNKAGVKRGGIMVSKDGKLIVELTGTQGIALPIKKDGKLLVDEDYLKFMLEKGNQKIERNYERLEFFGKCCRELLKD